jgi:SAM-dependent methyltransferase
MNYNSQIASIFKCKNDQLNTLASLVETILLRWPEHKKFLINSFSSYTNDELIFLNELTKDIYAISGSNLDEKCENYRWMCDVFAKEALYFLRHGRYRCANFEEAYTSVYSDTFFMKKYMDGLLISQILWANHAKCMIHFKSRFLSKLANCSEYLEVGPGHGLYLAQAARNLPHCNITAWDVSDESLKQSEWAFCQLDIKTHVNFIKKNVNTINHKNRIFDAIVISEVLEHTEDPLSILKSLSHVLKSDGLIFINFPMNSPAPDHIYLVKAISELHSMIIDAGYEIIESCQEPMTGYSINSAIDLKATINAIIIAKANHF